jgi:acetyl esterase/lipase
MNIRVQFPAEHDEVKGMNRIPDMNLHIGLSRASLLLIIVFLPGMAQAQTLYLDEQFGFSQTTGVVYASKPVGSPETDMDLQLELFQPTGAGVPDATPGLILIHGGGFSGGSRFNARLIQICQDMAKRGWTCVSIDYRLSGDDPALSPEFEIIETLTQGTNMANDPTAVAAASEDAWAAYQWMVTNAASLSVDINRIGLGGGSAGAVTSLIVGYLLDDLNIAAKGEIDAVFDMWGTLGDNPVTVQGDDPALFITHGEDDNTVSVSGAYALEDQAVLVGLPHEIHVFSNTGHGFNIYNYEVSPGVSVFDRFVDFFYQNVALQEPVSVPSFSAWSLTLMASLVLAAGVIRLNAKKSTGGSSR